MSLTHRARSDWGTGAKQVSLRCPADGCGWQTNRVPQDDGYGPCGKCGAKMQRFQPAAFSEKRLAKAKADLERFGL